MQVICQLTEPGRELAPYTRRRPAGRGATSAIGAMQMATKMSLALKRGGFAILLVMGAMLVAPAAFADDAALKQQIEDRLKKAKLETRGEIDVEVNDGLVTLRGAVDTVDA